MKQLAAILVFSCVLLSCGKNSSDSSTTASDKTSKAGLLLINPQFDLADPFSEGLAAVRVGDDKTGKWCFVDTHGKFVVNPQLEGLDRFSEGLAAALHEGKWGFIDKRSEE